MGFPGVRVERLVEGRGSNRLWLLVLVLAGCSGSAEDEGSTGSGGSAADVPGYCEIASIVESKCQRCHGETPENGAPFSLTSSGSFHETYQGAPVYEAVEQALSEDFMPPSSDWGFDPPATPLEGSEKEKLLAFVRGGAPDCPD